MNRGENTVLFSLDARGTAQTTVNFKSYKCTCSDAVEGSSDKLCSGRKKYAIGRGMASNELLSPTDEL